LRYAVTAGCFAASLFCVGCAAPQYDDQVDKAISTLQSDIDTELVVLSSLGRRIQYLRDKTDASSLKALAEAQAKASFDANSASYDKIRVDLTTVQIRVSASPSPATAQVNQALVSLNANLFMDPKSLVEVHRQQGVLGADYVMLQENILDQQLIALLRYVLVLKTGGSPSTSK